MAASTTTTKSVTFFNQGCRLNQSETATLEQQFVKDGYQSVPLGEQPQLIVVNTCTVTENGDTDTRRLVNKINRESPNSKIALIGCQAQILKEKLTELTNVQWVVGNAHKMALPNIIYDHQDDEAPYIHAPKINADSFTQSIPGIDTSHTRANLKIQDGCNFYCAFCIIPFARGPARSRNFEDSIREAHLLAEAGHKEVVLTGINLGTYEDQSKNITDLIFALETVPNLERIRISSIEPTTIPTEIINRMEEQDSKICAHFHVPLQAGSEDVLKLMNRHYTLNEFKTFMDSVQLTVPDCSFGTDVIVGFPGETDALFDETLSFLEKQAFSYFHVFSYSERTLARSRKFEGKVPQDVIKKRSKLLRDLSQAKQMAFNERFLGEVRPVLFEQEKQGYWIGLTDNYMKVKVKSPHKLKNQIHPVKLQRLDGLSIIGDLVNE